MMKRLDCMYRAGRSVRAQEAKVKQGLTCPAFASRAVEREGEDF